MNYTAVHQLRAYCTERGFTLHLYGGAGTMATALIYLPDDTNLQSMGHSQERAAQNMLKAMRALWL